VRMKQRGLEAAYPCWETYTTESSVPTLSAASISGIPTEDSELGKEPIRSN
jgi:hypothetical protein